MRPHHPERIVCLTEETTETLYLLGEEARIVGISGFTVRPPEARRDKPKVSAFTSAKTEKILDLAPDLVIGFSDLQADIAATLIRRGVSVLVFNHRSVEEIRGEIAHAAAHLEEPVAEVRRREVEEPTPVAPRLLDAGEGLAQGLIHLRGAHDGHSLRPALALGSTDVL